MNTSTPITAVRSGQTFSYRGREYDAVSNARVRSAAVVGVSVVDARGGTSVALFASDATVTVTVR